MLLIGDNHRWIGSQKLVVGVWPQLRCLRRGVHFHSRPVHQFVRWGVTCTRQQPGIIYHPAYAVCEGTTVVALLPGLRCLVKGRESLASMQFP